MPAVIFKGSGFYSTDNRKGSSSGNGASGSASSDSSDSGDKAASDGKPKAEEAKKTG